MLSISKGHWKNATFDGFDVDVQKIKCGEDKLLFGDYDKVKAYLKSPIRDLYEYKDIRAEYEVMLRHLDRHHNEIVFTRCNDRSCCLEWRSNHLKEFLSMWGMKLPTACPDSTREGHYQTFLQSCISKTNAFGNDSQPSLSNKDLGTCNICPSYSFTLADRKNGTSQFIIAAITPSRKRRT